MIYLLVGFVGACFGSFITAASYRLPRNENLVSERSHCTKCGATLKARDLIPIVSWLAAKGKCRACGVKISVRYILTEVLTAAVFVFLYWKYDLTPNFYILSALAVALLILIISDFETYIIPDSTTIAALILAIIWHYYNTADYETYIYGFLVSLFIALSLHYGYKWIMKKEGLGFGDVKFLPVAGLWIGLMAMPVYLIMSGLLGVITGLIWTRITGNKEFPFGPALAIAMFLIVLWPDVLILK